MNASYSIPETAKLTGIPEYAIREYAKQFADVLPSPETSEGGRAAVKRYPDAALEVFRSIRRLKDEGMDTAQIRSALQGPAGTDGYSDWDNIALQTSAETALDAEAEGAAEWTPETGETQAEAEGAAEWTPETGETEIEAATAETVSEEGQDTATGEWVAAEAEATDGVEAVAACEVEAEWTEETVSPSSESLTDHIVEEVPVAMEATADETPHDTWVETPDVVTEAVEAEAYEATPEVTEATAVEENTIPSTFHPLFTNLNDGLVQLRKIMDENSLERESLRSERERLLAETASQNDEIARLLSTVANQEEKIGGLQSALSVLMGQCDQQLQAIRSALGQA